MASVRDPLQAGDPDAWAAFYREHAPAVLGWLMRQVRDPEVAADLCAETFASALDGCRRFDARRGPAIAWVFGIARRQLAVAHRRGVVENRARRRLGMRPLDLTDEAIERIERVAAAAPALEALAGLPDDQRAAVEARVVGERPYAEIAAAVKTSESVVRKRVSRGLGAMRAQMEEQP